MASKLVPLNEAATLLGVSADELNNMRTRQEIYGYRDGASWKFKTEDIDRLKEEMAARQGAPLAGSGDDLLPVDIDSASGDDVVLLSELELGESEPSTSSTIIGAAAKVKLPSDSDLKLHSEPPDAGPMSDVTLAADSGLKLDSDIKLGSAESDIKLDSGIQLGSDEGSVLTLGTGSDVPLDLAESQTVVKTSSDMGRSGESSLVGGLASDSGLSLEGDGSDLKLSGGDSALHLADEADDVLSGSGSGSGSDITHRPSDSGILLIDPSDSGLSLDKPLDLAGGSDSLMGETTDFTADSGIKGDDDFLLTPLEEATEDESDSGSQVIMLDTEGEFDDATATLLASQIPGMGSMLEEESPLGGMGGGGGLSGLGGDIGGGPAATTARAPATAGGAASVMVPMRQEAPFGALTVLGLAACTMTLILGGILVFDVVRNMWSWDNPYGVDTLLISKLRGMFG